MKPINTVIQSNGPLTSTVNVFSNDVLMSSLHALDAFTRQDCVATFDQDGYSILHLPSKQIVSSNVKSRQEKLWIMGPSIDPTNIANLAVRNSLDAEYTKYISASLGNPPDSTLIKCCHAGFFTNLPRLTAKMIRQNLPSSLATSDGHLNRQRQHVQSTAVSPPPPKVPSDDDLFKFSREALQQLASSLHLPAIGKTTAIRERLRNYRVSHRSPKPSTSPIVNLTDDADPNDTILMIRCVELSDSELHADATGKFPYESATGTNYFLIFVFKNYIHIECIPNRSAPSYVAAYRRALSFFAALGHLPTLIKLDNETSALLESFLRSEATIDFEYVAPNDHRANRSERAIQSFKNHFLASFSSVAADFPMKHYDECIQQIELTLSLLRPYAGNPAISSYEGLYNKKYDFLAHPIAPIGTKVAIYNDATSRESWEPHSTPGHFLRSAPNHYRSFVVIDAITNTPRITNTLDWFPAPLCLPGSTKEEIILAALSSLNTTLSNINMQPADTVVAIDNAVLALKSALQSCAFPLDEVLTSWQLSRPPLPNHVHAQRVPDAPSQPAAEQRVVDSRPTTSDAPPRTSHPTASRKQQRKDQAKIDRLSTPLYRPLSRIECNLHAKYIAWTHRRFTDKDTNELFIIDDIVMLNVVSGPGSKTPHFRFYLFSQLDKPKISREYEYTRCSELLRADYASWLPIDGAKPTKNSRSRKPSANAILSKEPRTADSPPLNLTKDGKPISFSSEIKGPNSNYWIEANDEEFVRLFDSKTLNPTVYSDIPQNERKNVTYYNRQVKEKAKTVDDHLYTEYRVRGTYGGDRPTYVGPTASQTADLDVVKALWLSTLADRREDQRTFFATIDLVDFYLGSNLPTKGYVKIDVKLISPEIIDRYNLHKFIDKGFIYFVVDKCMYGHPAAGLISNKRLVGLLATAGYTEDSLVPCLFTHATRGTKFVLIVDDLGIKVRSEEDLQHLADAIRPGWDVKIDRNGKKFLNITLDWDLDREIPQLTFHEPNTVPKALARFAPNRVLKGRDTPSIYKSPTYTKEQTAVMPSTAEPVPEKKEFVQAVVGTFLYYGRVVDMLILEACNTIGLTQSNPTTETLEQVEQLLQYVAKYPNNKVVFTASDMELRCMYDASHHGIANARSKAGATFYAGNLDDSPTQTRNVFSAMCQVIKTVCASAVESEYGAAFMAGQKGYFLRNAFEALGHPQKATTFYGDNNITIGIATDNVKVKRSRAVNKEFHWFRDQIRLGNFEAIWIPTDDNLADYFTKALPRTRHYQLRHQLVYVPSNISED